MIKNRYTMLVCSIVVILALAVTGFLMFSPWLQSVTTTAGKTSYASRLLNDQAVHSIDISVDETEWENMLQQAMSKEYISCDITIDGEKFSNIAIRTKGNTSLSSVASMDSNRYSFKVEFDHYDSGTTYYGLDKLALNNIIQDNTYMKDYLSYKLMNEMGALAPLSSFANITVNGQAWGLYLAVEGIEEGFLERNFGAVTGKLYKPDTMKMGGNRDQGGQNGKGEGGMPQMPPGGGDGQFPQMGENGEMPQPPDGMMPGPHNGQQTAVEAAEDQKAPGPDGGMAEGIPSAMESQSGEEKDQQGQNTGERDKAGRGFGGFGGGDDVALVYTDDSYDSYSNIFDSAILDISNTDRDRLIEALKTLNQGEEIADAVNVDEVLRYFVVHNFVNNYDSYTGSMKHNYYLYENDGVLSMVAWDYNLGFSGFGGGPGGGGFGKSQTEESVDTATAQINYPIDTPLSGAEFEDRPMLGRLMEDPEYLEQYHQLFDAFISAYFESGRVNDEITRVFNMIAPYVQKDPSAFCTFEEFEQGVSTLREYCERRAESVRKQLNGEIPSTEEGQSADKSQFVDASHISISDMGSMGHGGGMGRAQKEGQQEQTAEGTGEETPAAPAFLRDNAADVDAEGQNGTQKAVSDPKTEETQRKQGEMTEGGAARETEGNTAQSERQRPGGMGSFPGRQEQQSGKNQDETWIELGLVAVILIIGLLFAVLYQKRKK